MFKGRIYKTGKELFISVLLLVLITAFTLGEPVVVLANGGLASADQNNLFEIIVEHEGAGELTVISRTDFLDSHGNPLIRNLPIPHSEAAGLYLARITEYVDQYGDLLIERLYLGNASMTRSATTIQHRVDTRWQTASGAFVNYWVSGRFHITSGTNVGVTVDNINGNASPPSGMSISNRNWVGSNNRFAAGSFYARATFSFTVTSAVGVSHNRSVAARVNARGQLA